MRALGDNQDLLDLIDKNLIGSISINRKGQKPKRKKKPKKKKIFLELKQKTGIPVRLYGPENFQHFEEKFLTCVKAW